MQIATFGCFQPYDSVVANDTECAAESRLATSNMFTNHPWLHTYRRKPTDTETGACSDQSSSGM